MALYDTDKASGERSNPVPNGHDNVDPSARMSHNTASTTYVGTGVNAQRQRVRQRNNQIILYDQNNLPSILIGSSPTNDRMGGWAIKPGLNVITELGG